MKKFKDKNILHNNTSLTYTLTTLEKTKSGQKFTDSDGKQKELTDSRQVSKRKRELKGAGNQLLETAQDVTNDRTHKCKTKQQEAPLIPDFIQFFATIVSKEISHFFCAITGSPRYDRIVSNYIYEVVSNTLINYLELPDESPEPVEDTAEQDTESDTQSETTPAPIETKTKRQGSKKQ